ncbi:hypothetical protein [Streptomyces canus]|uniref:hypothetical protein n=1 Tax=Streptomyces canus TaxID=58343 RepID=UPI0036E881E8
MGTSLTPDFWRLFAVLLVIFTAVTVVVSAGVDALVVRLLRHRRPAYRLSRTADQQERPLAHR